MKIRHLLLLASWSTFVAGETIVELLARIPSCAVNCTIPVFVALNCDISSVKTLAACACPDIAAQRNISACTQKHCNVPQQIELVEVSNSICMGYPIPSRSMELQAASIGLLCLVIFFVGLRLLSRYIMGRGLWWDDWTLQIAIVLSIAILCIEIPMAQKGFGKHIWNIDAANVTPIQLMFYISQILYVLVLVLTKISILVFYLRIFPQRQFQLAAIALIVFIGLHGVIYTFIIAFQCTPVSSIWNHAVSAKCLDKNAIVFSGAALSIVQDFLVLALPLPFVRSLNMKAGKRITLIIMFSIGSFVCITSIVRLKYIIEFGDYTDATWDNVDAALWSCIEISTAVVCTCLPSLRILMSRLFPGIFGQSQNQSGAMIPNSSYARKGSQRIIDTDSSTGIRSKKMNGHQSQGSTGELNSPWSPKCEETELDNMELEKNINFSNAARRQYRAKEDSKSGAQRSGA